MGEKGYFLCPNCGNHIEDVNTYTCPNCTYDFGQLIDCNYLVGNKCTASQKLCKIKGMNFQECNIYQQLYFEGTIPEENLD